MHNNIVQTTVLAHSNITTNTSTLSTIIDTSKFMGTEFIVTGSDITDGSYALAINEGNTVNSVTAPTSITDLAVTDSADLLATTANLTMVAADDGKSVRIGYIGNKRWVQLKITSTSTTTGAFFNCVVLQGIPKNAPTVDTKA